MTDPSEWKPMVQKTIVELEQALDELQKIWVDIGCTEETRVSYYEQAHIHIKSLLSDMVEESQSKKKHLLDSITELLKQTTVLYSELHLSVPETYDQGPLSDIEQMLRADLEKLKCLKKERLTNLKKLLAREHDICKKLGVQKVDITTNVPTEQELEKFELYLQVQEEKKNHLENDFQNMRCFIIKMLNELDMSPSSSFEHLVYDHPEDFVLSESNLKKLEEFRDQLKIQVEQMKCHIEKMKEDLLTLWKYLNEPIDVYMSFLDKYPGHSTATMNALSAEIKRCKEKRKENIYKYITQIRDELVHLWDLCRYCETERNLFVPFYSNTITEDLLTLHELEVERLRKFYNDNQTIFKLLEQRENLLNKIKELLQRTNNPDRFHNRGGQLLMEEKERNAILKKLPKIEEELKKLINEYENTHNKMFTIYGTSLENVLAESWQSISLEKETMKKARKEAKDKSIKKSPLNSSKKTPGMSHLSIHRGPMLGLSKRKLFSPSPNTSAKRRNKNGDKNKPTVIVSKIRRSGRIPKIVQKEHRSSKGERNKEMMSPNNSLIDTTYNQFQGHMTGREELHSSLLPEQVLRNSNKVNVKTPVRTPAKPLRKNFPVTLTPSSSRKTPHSPRIINTPKLTTAPSKLPFIF